MDDNAYVVRPIGWVESTLTGRHNACPGSIRTRWCGCVRPAPACDEGAPDAWPVFEPEVADGIRDLRPGAGMLGVKPVRGTERSGTERSGTER